MFSPPEMMTFFSRADAPPVQTHIFPAYSQGAGRRVTSEVAIAEAFFLFEPAARTIHLNAGTMLQR